MEALPPGPWGSQEKPSVSAQLSTRHQPGHCCALAHHVGAPIPWREAAAAPSELGWQTMFFKKQKPNGNYDKYLAPQISVERHTANVGKLCTKPGAVGFAWATAPQTPAKCNGIRCL